MVPVAPSIHDPFIILGVGKIDVLPELLNSRRINIGRHRQFRASGK
jgi:hypothetical protein